MLSQRFRSVALRFPSNARLTLRSSQPLGQYESPSRLLVISAQRYYATGGRPKKAVGEPSRPVKRAAKAGAKSTARGEAGKQLQAKKKNARAKKGTAKKAKPKKRVPKELTEAQQAARTARLHKKSISDLRKAALSPPSDRSVTALNVYIAENMKGRNRSGRNLGEDLKEVVSDWKQLAPADIEHYNHLAVQQTEAKKAQFKRWVESFSAEQIQVANRARASLRRKINPKQVTRRYADIRDERQVKRPVTSFIQFSINRHASGDFKNIALPERSKLIGQEWKALNESEKNKYKNMQHQDINRYTTEYKDVFGHAPPSSLRAAATA